MPTVSDEDWKKIETTTALASGGDYAGDHRGEFAEMKWQPIATAPKDGTPILGYDPDGIASGEAEYDWPDDFVHHCVIVCWAESEYGPGGWTTAMGEMSGGSSIYGEPDTWSTFEAQPTHWMPLPEPPTAINKDA